MDMLRVGLTGGIGSGKSAVAERFARRGVPVIDTDEVAREVVAPGEPALAEIVGEFGPGLVDAQGRLDRRRLRERVFADAEARRRLEAILHPRIREAVQRRIENIDATYGLIVVPLLVETGFGPLDRVLVVDVDEERQVERTSRRDNVPEESVRRIMQAQATRAERLARADDVIINNGAPDDLERQVDELHARYLALARTD